MVELRENFWSRRAHDGMRAASEALFPKNTLGAPDFEETELVRRTTEFIALLPPTSRPLLVALFVLVELGLPLLRFRFGRFSRQSVESRLEIVRSLRASRLYPLRLIGDSVKGALTMNYMSHPKVVAHIGMFSACERPDDPFMVHVRLDALTRQEVR